jgi:acetate kinase
VGEFGDTVREKSCAGLEHLGIKLDKEKNKLARTRNAETVISADDSPVKIFVIPTDEELVMTEDAYALMKGTYDVHTNFTYSFQSPDYVNKARAEGLKANLAKSPALAKIIVK